MPGRCHSSVAASPRTTPFASIAPRGRVPARSDRTCPGRGSKANSRVPASARAVSPAAPCSRPAACLEDEAGFSPRRTSPKVDDALEDEVRWPPTHRSALALFFSPKHSARDAGAETFRGRRRAPGRSSSPACSCTARRRRCAARVQGRGPPKTMEDRIIGWAGFGNDRLGPRGVPPPEVRSVGQDDAVAHRFAAVQSARGACGGAEGDSRSPAGVSATRDSPAPGGDPREAPRRSRPASPRRAPARPPTRPGRRSTRGQGIAHDLPPSAAAGLRQRPLRVARGRRAARRLRLRGGPLRGRAPGQLRGHRLLLLPDALLLAAGGALPAKCARCCSMVCRARASARCCRSSSCWR